MYKCLLLAKGEEIESDLLNFETLENELCRLYGGTINIIWELSRVFTTPKFCCFSGKLCAFGNKMLYSLLKLLRFTTFLPPHHYY